MAGPAVALPDNAPHLLVVDDDRRIRDLLSRFLFSEGYRVTTADNAADARAKLESLSFDLLVLDVMMPGETGFQLAKSLRESSAVPILMLTAKAETESRITGLELGADDYVPKPFEPRELSLRIANILKRTIPAPPPAIESVRFGDFVFHLGARRAARAATRSCTSPTASATCCACSPPRRARPCRAMALGGNGGGANERAVDVQVNRLRRKIERDPANPLFVQTVRGIGYRLVVVAMTIARRRPCDAALRGRACVGGVGRVRALDEEHDADRPLRPRAAHHHRADGAAAVGRRLRVHGAALEHGDAAALGGGDAGHRGADRDLSQLSAGRRAHASSAGSRGAARPVGRLPAVSEMPPPGPKPFFSLLDQALSQEIRQQIRRPFWIDTVGRSNLVEIRIRLDDTVMRVFALRSAAYASNSEIFLFWMVGTSLVLLAVAILFLRNQIKPILRLADAAESFGKGRDVPGFKPRGAREVRRAAQAFIEMKRRIERTMEQRTTMLAGVSHDLRTILTRFKLELALIGDGPEVDAMKKDVDEMGRMLEAYLAFARATCGEQPAPTDMAAFLDELKADAERNGHKTSVAFYGHPIVTVRPAAFRRCLANLVSNAARFAQEISITGHRDHRWLTVTVDDDGPGIPAEMREEVFSPFLRLDDARNQDEGGTGLGLAIARDIARSHGGDITLGDSPLGGLRATVRVPV